MSSHDTDAPHPHVFLFDAGEIGETIAHFDWSSTPIGALENWPTYLKTTVALLLRSPVPIVTLWGESGVMIYNQAYSVFAGGRHPRLLGSNVREGWPEVADFNDHVMKVCLGGGILTFQDQELTLYRHGSAEQVWMNLDYSPIMDEAGKAVGVIAVVVETTAKVRAERWLAGEQQRLSRMFEQAPGFMAILSGPDHVFEQVNPAYQRLVGERDLLGKSLREAFPEPSAKLLQEKLDQVRRSGQAFAATSLPVTLRKQIRQGSSEFLGSSLMDHTNNTNHTDHADLADHQYADFSAYVDVVYQPLRDEHHNVVGIFIQGTDVTERVFAEQALRRSEANFRSLAQALPNQVWAGLPEGQLEWFNDRVYEYSGQQPGTLDGTEWLTRMVHADDLEEAIRRWALALRKGSTYECEVRLRSVDGVYRWHLARALPVRDEFGRVTRWIGTHTDIEDQKALTTYLAHVNASLEQQVATRTADHDRIWRLSHEIMLVATFDAMITAVNPAWTVQLGWTEAELLGRSFMSLVHPADRAATLAELDELSKGTHTFRFENRFQRKDGGYSILSWTAVPDAHFVHAVARDVTAEREAAAAHRRTELALQQAQKMETIGKLTGGVAHDFNNLLQVISGNLQLLANDVRGNAQAARRVENALAGVSRGAKLASHLLAFGRRQALAPKAIKIGRLVSGMEDMLRRSLGEAIETETIVSGGLWSTFVDPAHVENAILNLAINARDAMDGVGKLTLEVGNAYLDSQYAREHVEVTPGQYVMLAVSDTGSGMTPEVLSQAFEPFFSTKPEAKGTGLGLSMVYGFVKQSGGHVAIYSEIGQGTTVRIYLPRTMEEEALTQPVDVLPVIGGAETILVAEDDAEVRGTVVDMLGELGYRVLKARDAQSALTIIESGVPIDLLFTDVVMPGPLRSPELARKARERQPRMAVLFTSGYTENAIVHGGKLDNGVELLTKPYTREALARKLRHVLANHQQHLSTMPAFQDKDAPQTFQANNAPALAPSTPLAASASGASGASSASGKRTLLLVEDDDLIRWNTSELLQELGHRVLEAGTAKEALDHLQKAMHGQETIHVLFTDLGLPDASGEALAQQARQMHPSIGVVFATGNVHDSALKNAVLLQKPYDSARITNALRAAASAASAATNAVTNGSNSSSL